MDKNGAQKGSLKAYVNKSEGRTKVVIDETHEIYVNVTNGPQAKQLIASGTFDPKRVCSFTLDENTRYIRERLKKLSEEICNIYEQADRRSGFVIYDKETVKRTDDIAWEIYDIKTNGI